MMFTALKILSFLAYIFMKKVGTYIFPCYSFHLMLVVVKMDCWTLYFFDELRVAVDHYVHIVQHVWL